MKRLISLLTAIFLFVALPCTTLASDIATSTSENSQITYLDDGSYYVTTITESLVRSTKTGSRSTTYYSSSDVAQWKVTVKGTFSYDGTSATCTSASHTVTIYDDDWYTYSQNSYESSNKAIAEVTMKLKMLGIVINTRDVTITLTCDKNGNLS